MDGPEFFFRKFFRSASFSKPDKKAFASKRKFGRYVVVRKTPSLSMSNEAQISSATFGVAYTLSGMHSSMFIGTNYRTKRTVAVRHRTLSALTSFANLATNPSFRQANTQQGPQIGLLPFR